MKRTKDESGAYAILFAVMALMLMTIAALAVDIGNAVARKSDVQGQADFAALSGARELTSSTPAGAPPAAVVNSVRDYLNLNKPANKPDTCTAEAPCVTSAQLTDGNLANGEVRYANGGLQVIAPNELVSYGFARVIGFNSQNVQASATVAIKSPGGGTLPMYAVAGCDYGSQTLTDPANGQVTPVTPTNLALPNADNNDAIIDSIATPNPPQIPVQTLGEGPELRLNGSKFVDSGNNASREHVTRIGFFREDGTTIFWRPVADADRTNTSVRIPNIPTEVATFEGLWWVRVWKERVENPDPATGSWSSLSTAKPFRVGNAILECDAGSNGGNFGTLRIDRTDVNASGDDLPVNIVESFEAPISLAIHGTVAANGECEHGTSGAVESGDPNPGKNPGTNCVDTDPGLPAGVATEGLVKGVNTSKGLVYGRLNGAQKPTDTDCGRANFNLTLNNVPYPVNNDVLSCYLKAGMTVSEIATPTYSGDSVLDEDVFLSPRFFWLPVLATEPSNGLKSYSIIDFRPGFITGEDLASSRGNSITPVGDIYNGLRVQNNNIIQVKVIFFDVDALPDDTPGPTTDYLGVGPKLIRLID